jgi:4-hydroxybenzoate polyprenyltransferase
VATVPAIIGTTYYLVSKRHIYFPQSYWASALPEASWLAAQPWEFLSRGWNHPGCINAPWVGMFDTIYAHQYLVDDVKIGVMSMVLLFQGRMKLVLRILYSGIVACLAPSGI